MIFKLNKLVLIFSAVCIIGLTQFSCEPKTNSDNSKVETVNVKDLNLSPVVHDTLNKQQIGKIKIIQEIFAEVNPSTLDETITNFKRDQNPDNEIAIWLTMATAYEKFILKNKNINFNKKEEAYKLILMRSMENETEAKLKSNLKLLSDKEVSEIFSYYNLEAKPIKVEQK
jgi:hypothetical protein